MRELVWQVGRRQVWYEGSNVQFTGPCTGREDVSLYCSLPKLSWALPFCLIDEHAQNDRVKSSESMRRDCTGSGRVALVRKWKGR